jgi:hypothetical protein
VLDIAALPDGVEDVAAVYAQLVLPSIAAAAAGAGRTIDAAVDKEAI